MNFLDELFVYWKARSRDLVLSPEGQRGAVAEHWGLEDTDPSVPNTASLDYDRLQWRKHLKRLLGELPMSQDRWPDLHTEASALGFEADWLHATFVDEFRLLVRRAVADCVFTDEERARLELARSLVGLEESEAAVILKQTIAEAESFFGKSIARS